MGYLWRIGTMPGSREAVRLRHCVWFCFCWLAPYLLACLMAPAAAALDVPYSVEIAGVEDKDLRGKLEELSVLLKEKERPPPTLAALRRRAESDLTRLDEALASFGYYDAELTYDVDTKKSPVAVVIHVKLGEIYRLAGFTIAGDNPALRDGRIRIEPKKIGLEAGSVAASRTVIDAEQKILALLAEQAYPLARVEDRRVVVDHATRRMTVEWRIDTGPKARFGEVTIEGLKDVHLDFVQSLLPWRRGELYDSRKVEAGRVTLVDTRVFGSVRIAHGDKVDADGELPMTVTLTEAKHRSIGVGLRYSTNEGPLGKIFWEHRNLFHEGESLNLSLTSGFVIQGVGADFRKPGVWTPDLDFLSSILVERENRESYESESAGTNVGFEYRLSETMTTTGGVGFELERIDEDNDKRDFGLLSFPLSFTYDNTADLLDPKSGTRANAALTPYASVVRSDVNFLVMRLSDSVYVPLQEDGRLVLAGWARFGSIVGAETTSDIPATKRLYGGGASSVRAYGYEELGPVGADGDPTGGRSLLELGTELRWRMFEDVGGVAFVEGGNVYDNSLPEFDERILWGAGVGVRYYTEFGPLRFDIAFPINPRDTDDAFQFYVGIGQAF
jgi:translocation and assembly module TamA